MPLRARAVKMSLMPGSGDAVVDLKHLVVLLLCHIEILSALFHPQSGEFIHRADRVSTHLDKAIALGD
jgi:hypothetical protein